VSGLQALDDICSKYNRKLTVVPFDSICYDLEIKATGRHIETIYSKLFYSRLLSIDKIFYLDSDTVVIGSLDELWSIDMGDNAFAGVNARAINSAKELDLPKKAPFINDGVVLINLRVCRQQDMLEKFKLFIHENDGDPPLLSEGVINQTCVSKILVLHPKFNLMSGLIEFKGNRSEHMDYFYDQSIIAEAVASPVVVHYLSAFYNRPWDINCSHPMKHHYLFYKSISVWKDVPLTNKKLHPRLRLISILSRYLPEIIFSYLHTFKQRLM